MNQPLSGEISASSSRRQTCSIGVCCHSERRWIVIVRETSRLSERWKRWRFSPCRSATSHFRLVQAALLTETYTAL